MDWRPLSRWRQTSIVTICSVLALMCVQSCVASAAASNDRSPRREVASISASQLNRNRNLRQAYDGSGLQYSEIVPQHSFVQYDDDYNVKRTNNDNRKPSFYACKDYAPNVREEQPPGTYINRVEARDPDQDDTITYSLEKSASERPKFRIDSKSGELFTVYTFDRDEPIREKEVRIFGVHMNLSKYIRGKEMSRRTESIKLRRRCNQWMTETAEKNRTLELKKKMEEKVNLSQIVERWLFLETQNKQKAIFSLLLTGENAGNNEQKPNWGSLFGH